MMLRCPWCDSTTSSYLPKIKLVQAYIAGKHAAHLRRHHQPKWDSFVWGFPEAVMDWVYEQDNKMLARRFVRWVT